MNQWIKLIIPIFLGGAAFIANWVAIAGKSMYVCAKSSMTSGAVIDDSMLTSIPGDPSWKGTVISYDERAMLYGRPALRALKKGDVLFWRDIQPIGRLALQPGESGLNISLAQGTYEPELLKIGENIGFVVPVFPPASQAPVVGSTPKAPPTAADFSYEVLGPFRVVGVGARTDETDEKTNRNSSTVTVAIKLGESKRLDAAANRLMQANLMRHIVALTVASRP